MKETEYKKIAKLAKSRKFDNNLEAVVLFRLLANIGGTFGMIMRHQVEEYSDLDEAENETEAYAFLNWLPYELKEKLINESKNNLIKASFITNENSFEILWHISCCFYRANRIKTIARNWVAKNHNYLKNNQMRDDGITKLHFL
jgi:hypothetical protein